MPQMLRVLVYIIIGVPLFLIVVHTIVRVVRHFYKFPMPEFAANIIDNPIRRRIQPPDETAVRHGIEPGLFSDPDYPLPVTIERMAESSGFRRKAKIGNFVYYTLIFEKGSES